MFRLLQHWKVLLLLLCGSGLLAVGVAWFALPCDLVTGGISGLAIVIRHLSRSIFGFEIPVSVTTVALNIPLFALGVRQRGFAFARKSVAAVALLSAWLWVLERLPAPLNLQGDLLLGALFCGALSGVGIGLVLRAEATSGGSDMFASIVKFRYPHYSINTVILWADAVVIACGLFVFGGVRAMYAVLSAYVCSAVTGNVLTGFSLAKAAFILSEQTESITSQIMGHLSRGVTCIHARGGYTGQERELLLVVVARKEVAALRQLVKSADPAAFLIITDAHEVLGQGFVEEYNTLTM